MSTIFTVQTPQMKKRFQSLWFVANALFWVFDDFSFFFPAQSVAHLSSNDASPAAPFYSVYDYQNVLQLSRALVKLYVRGFQNLATTTSISDIFPSRRTTLTS